MDINHVLDKKSPGERTYHLRSLWILKVLMIPDNRFGVQDIKDSSNSRQCRSGEVFLHP